MENRFFKGYKVDKDSQFLVLRTEGVDYSVIDECTCIKGTIVKNSIDFNGPTHKEDSFKYLDEYDQELAVSQWKSLCERIQDFLNPNP